MGILGSCWKWLGVGWLVGWIGMEIRRDEWIWVALVGLGWKWRRLAVWEEEMTLGNRVEGGGGFWEGRAQASKEWHYILAGEGKSALSFGLGNKWADEKGIEGRAWPEENNGPLGQHGQP